jgi:hypothetical protein
VKKEYAFHPYLINAVLKRRSFTTQMCIRIIENPVKKVRQNDGRFRYYGKLREFPGKWIRVVTLEDDKTIFNIFIDRDFKK